MTIKSKAKMFRQFIEQMASDVDDQTSLEFPEAFPKWREDILYKVNDRVRYADILYKVLPRRSRDT